MVVFVFALVRLVDRILDLIPEQAYVGNGVFDRVFAIDLAVLIGVLGTVLFPQQKLQIAAAQIQLKLLHLIVLEIGDIIGILFILIGAAPRQQQPHRQQDDQRNTDQQPQIAGVFQIVVVGFQTNPSLSQNTGSHRPITRCKFPVSAHRYRAGCGIFRHNPGRSPQ